jgi:hypothetical protein
MVQDRKLIEIKLAPPWIEDHSALGILPHLGGLKQQEKQVGGPQGCATARIFDVISVKCMSKHNFVMLCMR